MKWSPARSLLAQEDLTETLASVVRHQAHLSAAPPELRPLLERYLKKDPRNRLRDISGVDLLIDAGRPEVPIASELIG